MGFLDFFRRPTPICEVRDLADFIDENAAFLVQKGLYEYSRARAGHYAKVMFGEKPFQELIESARWRAYPLGLAMVAEVVERELRSKAEGSRGGLLEDLKALVLQVFDRYPAPPSIGAAAWRDLRETLGQRLSQIGLHPPKAVKDIAEPYADSYFALMPIHEKLRGPDAPTLRNYLRVSVLNIHERLVNRLDARALLGGWSKVTT